MSEISPFSALGKKGHNYGDLPKIYARLAYKLFTDLMQKRGMNQEEAEKLALDMILGQAAETIHFIDDYRAEFAVLRANRKLANADDGDGGVSSS